MKTSINSSSKKKICVVTVVYNGVNSIKGTIESVLNQKSKNYDYIIIDGGSTDGTTVIIENYLPRLKFYVSEKDSGIYNAMNKSLKYIEAEYVIFLNSGDIFSDESVIESVAKYLHIYQSNPEVLYGDYRLASTGETIYQNKKINKYFFYNKTLCHQAVFVRADTLNDIGGFDEDFLINADREALLRINLAGGVFGRINKTICDWEQEGFSRANKIMMENEINRIRLKYFFIEYCLHKIVKKIKIL